MRLSLLRQLGIAIAALVVYLFIIYALKAQPFSDFEDYYRLALGLSKGGELNSFYRYFQAPGHPYLLAALFRIFSSDSLILPQIFNAVAMVFIGLLLINSRQWETRRGAVLAFCLITMNPNCLLMVPVLCSEIPYALFFAPGIALFCVALRRPHGETLDIRTPLLALSAGSLLGVSQAVRPVTTPLLIIFIVILLIGRRWFHVDGTGSRWGAQTSRRVVLPLVAGYLSAALLLYGAAGYGITLQPHQKGLASLYVGFNQEAGGNYSTQAVNDLVEIGDRHAWRPREVNREFMPIVMERLKTEWARQFLLLPGKVIVLLKPAPIADWALSKSSVKDQAPLRDAIIVLSLMNVAALGICVAGLLGLTFRRNISLDEYLAVAITAAVLSYIMLHSYLFQVQPRYANHLWLLLFWLTPLHLATVQRLISGRAKSPAWR